MDDKRVCVVTGGGSGMGLEAAKILGQGRIAVLTGRTVAKLEHAVTELEAAGVEAHVHACDVSQRQSVRELAEYAAGLGRVTNVVHAAGVSPTMGTPEQMVRIDAPGTVYVNQEFARVMGAGSVIVDVASNSAYALPKLLINEKIYRLAEQDEDAFIRRMLKKANLAKSDYNKSGFAYALSKNFAVWYAQKSAFDLGEKGIRVASLSPGLIATGMGKAEASHGDSMLKYGAERRMGTPEELGFALATLADERNGYLAGVDVLVDGGCTNGRRFRK